MRSAADMDATAYTVGNRIVFGKGAHDPGDPSGRALLAHELTHVVQQSGAAGQRVLQRQRRGGAGGCGICLGGPHIAGAIAHEEIQFAFLPLHPDIMIEHPVPVVPGDQTPPFAPRLDLALETRTLGIRTIHIGEIKPLDDAGAQGSLAHRQLGDYARELRFTYDQVFRLMLPPPPGPLPFINPNRPPGCPQQLLHVRRTAPGVYQYHCEPPFSQLVAMRSCRCRRRRREEQRQRQEQRRRVPRRVTPRVTVPDAPPVPVTPPVGAPVPGGRPDTAPESQPGRLPDWVPQAARVALVGAALAGITALGRRLGRAAARRALVYAEAMAVAALVVFYSDRVEARAGPGESPLETLFDAMEQDGVPVPEDLRQRIESNPSLRAALEQAATSGDLSAAQEEISRQMMDVIAQNPEAFTEEELEILLQASESAGAGASGARPTVETLRRAVEAKRRGQPVGPVVRRGAAPRTRERRPARAPETPAPIPETPEQEDYPGISDELRQRLAENREVRRLFDAMTSVGGSGPTVTNEVLERFLATVPQDLNGTEADALIAELRRVRGQTVDEILSTLSRSVQRIRQPGGQAADESGDLETGSDGGREPAETRRPDPSRPAAPAERQPSQGAASAPPAARQSVGQRVAALLSQIDSPTNVRIPESELRAGATRRVFVARMRGRFLVGGFATFTTQERLGQGRWRVIVHPTDWFNQSGQFVERMPPRDTTDTLTYPRNRAR